MEYQLFSDGSGVRGIIGSWNAGTATVQLATPADIVYFSIGKKVGLVTPAGGPFASNTLSWAAATTSAPTLAVTATDATAVMTYVEAGIGIAIKIAGDNRKVGVIGLGTGTLAAWGKPGDTFRFYEINPQVVDVARREFTFMTDTPAKIEVVLGDGRLSLEREPDQQFDVLAMDAFSGDSIPMHLLTREAMQIYLRHLKPGGVIIFQATNRFINIAPIVASLANEFGMASVLISDSPESEEGPDYWTSSTDQVIVTSNRALLQSEKIRSAATEIAIPAGFRVWTDDFNNLVRVLK